MIHLGGCTSWSCTRSFRTLGHASLPAGPQPLESKLVTESDQVADGEARLLSVGGGGGVEMMAAGLSLTTILNLSKLGVELPLRDHSTIKEEDFV